MFINRINPLESPYNQLWISIAGRIKKTLKRNFDIFFQILSNSTWQSPREIAAKWIMDSCPAEWSELKDNPNEELQTRREKETVRKQVLYEIGLVVLHIAENPPLHQKMSTRLLVKRTLADTLSTHDQDRILTAELLTSYAKWKSLLSSIAQHSLVTDEQALMEVPYFHLDDAGDESCVIKVNGHIEPIETLPDIPLHHDALHFWMNLWFMALMAEYDITEILLTDQVLRRHTEMLHPNEVEQKVRNSVFEIMRWVPVYKKRWFGTATSGRVLDWKLSVSPA